MPFRIPPILCISISRSLRYVLPVVLFSGMIFWGRACAAEIPPLPDVDASVATARPDLVAQRATLMSERVKLRARTESHNTACNAVVEGSEADSQCMRALERLKTDLEAHIRKSNQFIRALRNAAVSRRILSSDGEREYEPSGNALVGGTSWIIGYYVREGADYALLVKEQKIVKNLAEFEGKSYSEQIDFHRYNFVLGIAASTEIFSDLLRRVGFDELSNGRFSTEQGELYNSMKGRAFNELACHSNGAMLCLMALTRRDVTAKHVVLYGPQITPESLQMWDKLIKDGRISNLEINLNQGDPVPAVSMLASNPAVGLLAIAAPFLAAPLFSADVMSKAISAFAPSAHVKTFACGTTPDINCHDMKAYRERRGCVASTALSAQIVPGTRIQGRSGVVEPPMPCY